MSAFEKLTVLAKQVFARRLRVGDFDVQDGVSMAVTPVRGNPNGQLPGIQGDLAMDISAPQLYQKTGSRTLFTTDGWVAIGGSAASSTESLPYGFKITGLAAARTGAVATTTLLFAGVAVPDLGIPVATWCQQVNDANGGTTFQITVQGKYIASLSLLNSNNDVGQAATIGVSVDATVAQQAQTPIITQSSVRATSGQSDDNFPSWIHCTAEFFVTDEMIAGGLGIVRAQVGPFPTAVATLPLLFTGFVMVRAGDARLPT